MSPVSAKVLTKEAPRSMFNLAVVPGPTGARPVLCAALVGEGDPPSFNVRAESLAPGEPMHRIAQAVKAYADAMGDASAVVVLSDETDAGAVLTVMMTEAGLRARPCVVTAGTDTPGPWDAGAVRVGERPLVGRWRSLLERGLVRVAQGGDVEVLKQPLGVRAAALACWPGSEGSMALRGGSLGFVRMGVPAGRI